MINNKIKLENFFGKKIFIAENHHFLLYAWAEIRKGFTDAPKLISFDQHTDIQLPFLSYCANNNKDPLKALRKEYDDEFAKELVDGINYNDLATVEEAISNLKHDEHITTAIESDIISKAFIIACNNNSDIPCSYEEDARRDKHLEISLALALDTKHPNANLPKIRNYPVPKDKIYIPRWSHGSYSEDEDQFFVQALETNFLRNKFEVFKQMSPSDILTISDTPYMVNKPYILDIDLDYFHGRDSINPAENNFFYNLIRGAEIITIAKESVCVEMVKEQYGILDRYDSSWLLERLLEHVRQALEE